MSITWLSLWRDRRNRPGPSQPATKTIYKYSESAWAAWPRYKTTRDFNWEPFIVSVINDETAGVTTTERQPGLAIHLFLGQETVISLEVRGELISSLSY